MKPFLLLCFSAAFLLPATTAYAQDDPFPACELQPVFGCETYMTKALKEAGRQIGVGVGTKIALAADLNATRQKLAQACHTDPSLRDHPERLAAMRHLTELLDIKDAYFIRVQYDVLGWGPGMREHNEAIDALTSGGKPFDGGPRPNAPWTDFINAENELAKSRATDFAGVLANAADANSFKTNGRYRRYLVARNLLEVNAAGCNITADSDLLWQDALLIDQPWKPYTRTPEDSANVRQYFAGANSLFGEPALRGATQTTLAMPKSGQGQYRLPDGYQTGLMDALLYALEVQSDRAYARKALLTWERTFKVERFEQTRQVEAMLVAAYGDAAIDRAGHMVRSAPRTADGHISGFGSGWRGVYVRPALFDALARNDPKGYVRAILAFDKHLTEKPAVDEAYAQLVSAHGAAAVEAAGASLLALWAAPESSVPAADRQQDAYKKHFNGADPGADAPLLYARLGKSRSYDASSAGASDAPSTGTSAPSTGTILNPAYKAWSRFAPGAVAVYASHHYLQNGTGGTPRTTNTINVYRLKSINSNVAVVFYSGRSLSDGNKIERDELKVAHLTQEQWQNHLKEFSPLSRTSGSDTLRVNGKTYRCTWERTTFRDNKWVQAGETGGRVETVWTSDEVPGGMVRKLTVNGTATRALVTDEVLQPFNLQDSGAYADQPLNFDVISAAGIGRSSDVTAIAPDAVSTPIATNGRPAELPHNQLLYVSLRDGITIADADRGAVANATLTRAVPVSGGVYPVGAVVRLRLARGRSGDIEGSPEALLTPSGNVPIHGSGVCHFHASGSGPASGRTGYSPYGRPGLNSGQVPGGAACAVVVNP